jgi:hypothetical protein
MKIKKGDRFVCVKKITTDCGYNTFKKGAIYTSDWDGSLIYKKNIIITIVEKHIKHFVKLNNK